MHIFCTLIFLHFLTVFHIFAAAIWNLARMIVKPIKTIMIMKTRNLLMLLLLAMMPLAASAYDFEVDGLYYEKTGEGEVKVTHKDARCSYDGAADVVVPSEITVDGSVYKVKTIGILAFAEATDAPHLKSVTLSEGIERIETVAFTGARYLTKVVLPSTLRYIGSQAFVGCRSLKEVSLPEGLEEIDYMAFSQCALTSLVIPSTVRKIGFSVLGDSPVKELSVAEGNAWYDSRENCQAIVETATNTLIQGTAATCIPADVTAIDKRAFYMMKLESLTIPAGIKEIGDEAFGNNWRTLSSVYCYSEVPVGSGHGLFTFLTSSDFVLTLYVPKGCSDAYRAHPEWGLFPEIKEFDPKNEASPTGIGVAETGVAGVEACYSADGKRLQAPVRGLNIVRMSDGTTKKVVMK